MTDALRALIDSAGIAGRRIRTVVRLLTEQTHTLTSLVHESRVERRDVEAVLAVLDSDLQRKGDRMWIATDRVARYREMIDYSQLVRTELADPLATRLAAATGWVAEQGRLISTAPLARRALDHVSATAETAVRRALWLDATYDLNGARLLCLGDHDLTSLAMLRVNPNVDVMVVDVDERVLEFIDTRAHYAGWSVRCRYADLRFGLPRSALGWADLLFTDPPYTPEAVRLFLARGLAALRDTSHARLVMAYGFAENHPALGLKVQQATVGLQLVYEAVLPNFNRYHGAQAVGGSSDLYVLRPTSRSVKVAEQTNIYTHGSQSLEGASGLADDVAQALVQAATGPGSLPLVAVSGGPELTGPARVSLATLLVGGLPAQHARQNGAVAVDLSGDPGSWLVRLLLAVDVERLAVLVPNSHPDLRNEAAQRELAGLLQAKYRLRLRRSAPSPAYAIVEAERVDRGTVASADRIVRGLLDRPHGKVVNAWRDALVEASAEPLTKNEARDLVRSTASRPEVLDEPLIDLPRHLVGQVVSDAGTRTS